MTTALIHPPVEKEAVVTPRPVRKVVQVVTKEVVLLMTVTIVVPVVRKEVVRLVTVKIQTMIVIAIKALTAL